MFAYRVNTSIFLICLIVLCETKKHSKISRLITRLGRIFNLMDLNSIGKLNRDETVLHHITAYVSYKYNRLQTVLFVCVAAALASILGVRNTSPASGETIEKLSSSLFQSLNKRQDNTELTKDEFIDISALALESLTNADLRTLYEVVFVAGDFEFGRSDDGQVNLVASPSRRPLVATVEEGPADEEIEEKDLLLIDVEDDGKGEVKGQEEGRGVTAEDGMEGFLEVYSIALFGVKVNGGGK
jgi:hypothetical protein